MDTPHLADDVLLTALHQADPGSRVVMTEDSGLRLLRAAAAAERPRSRRRLVATIASCAAAVMLAVPATAAASGYLARTGWFGNPEPGSPAGTTPRGTEADGSEYIDQLAPDYVAFATLQWPNYARLPKGYDSHRFAQAIATQDAAQAAQTARQVGSKSSLIQVTSIVGHDEMMARCVWQAEWLEADADDDTARATAAAKALNEAARWPATVATDGGGVVQGELTVAAAAASGDRAEVQAHHELNCPAGVARLGR